MTQPLVDHFCRFVEGIVGRHCDEAGSVVKTYGRPIIDIFPSHLYSDYNGSREDLNYTMDRDPEYDRIAELKRILQRVEENLEIYQQRCDYSANNSMEEFVGTLRLVHWTMALKYLIMARLAEKDSQAIKDLRKSMRYLALMSPNPEEKVKEFQSDLCLILLDSLRRTDDHTRSVLDLY